VGGADEGVVSLPVCPPPQAETDVVSATTSTDLSL
jgi:hypothetical protein